MTAKAGLLIAAMFLMTPAMAAEATCSPPCGWVQPNLDIIIEDKLTCGSGIRLGDEEIDPALCYQVPTEDKPVVIDGMFRLYWEVSEEATYPHDPNQPIEVDFANVGTTGKWLSASVEPNTISIGTAELADPNNFQIRDLESGSPSVWFWFEQPLTITYEKVGEPTEADWELIGNKGGYQPMFLRVHSGESGVYFKQAWALEEFRFYTGTEEQFKSGNIPTTPQADGESNSTPAIPILFAILGLALLARRKL
ncbi:MAG: hypothetical protein ACPHK8_01500 [Thermoplasmatota archaeon]